jgi:anti-sigma B factor antagonist
MRMTISEHAVGDTTVLTLSGRLVLEEGEDPLREYVDRLVREGRVRLVLDMAGVTFIDSAGLGTLVGKYVSVHKAGGDIKLLNLTPRTAHLFEITKLTRVFEAFRSEQDAVRSFAAH